MVTHCQTAHGIAGAVEGTDYKFWGADLIGNSVEDRILYPPSDRPGSAISHATPFRGRCIEMSRNGAGMIISTWRGSHKNKKQSPPPPRAPLILIEGARNIHGDGKDGAVCYHSFELRNECLEKKN